METEENNVTRAVSSAAAKAKTGTSSKTGKTSSAKKPASGKTASAKKPASGKTSKTGKTSSSAKKTSSTGSSVRLSKAEKELVLNYRKCSSIEKKFLSAAAEKAAEGMDFDNLLGILKAFL